MTIQHLTRIIRSKDKHSISIPAIDNIFISNTFEFYAC